MRRFFPGANFSANRFIHYETISLTQWRRADELPETLSQLKIINATPSIRAKGRGIRVAVIDTGMAEHHEGLKSSNEDLVQSQMGWNFGDNNKDLSDPTQHGTTVGGLIADRVVGVAPEVKIIPLKVINTDYKIDEASVIAAIHYAIEKKIPIINISLGKSFISSSLQFALTEAEQKGILIVAAAGNQGRSCEEYKQFPAAQKSSIILSVGATLINELNPFQIAPYSNYGECVALAAPGGDLSEGLWAPVWHNSQSFYQPVNGTSMAAPLVSGAAAIVKSLHPEWTGSQIRDYLLTHSRPSSDLDKYISSKGLLRLPSQ
jgi:subtilisin family serine protease